MSNRISGSKPSQGRMDIAEKSKADKASAEKGAQEAKAAGDAKDAANISTAQSTGSAISSIGGAIPGPVGAGFKIAGTATQVGAGIAGTTKAKSGAAKGAGIAGTVAAGAAGGASAKQTLDAHNDVPPKTA